MAEMRIGKGKARAPLGDRPQHDKGDRLIDELLGNQGPDPHAGIGHGDAGNAAGDRTINDVVIPASTLNGVIGTNGDWPPTGPR